MIQLREFPFPLIEVFSPEGNCIGNITSHEMLTDLQLQICKTNAVGWTLHWNDRVITIEPNGDLSDWPVDMVGKYQTILGNLFREIKNSK
jgi:hypothetical protein